MQRVHARLGGESAGPLPTVLQEGQRRVSIGNLLPDPENEREALDEQTVEDMAASIRAEGIIEPITATAVAEGKYMVLAGHTRLEAAKRAGLTHVDIVLAKAKDGPQRRRQSLISNIHRRDLSIFEIARALQSFLDSGMAPSQSDLARSIGKDRAWVSTMLRVIALPEDVKEIVGSSQQPVANDTIIKIARLDDQPELQRELARDVAGGAKAFDIRDKINESKGRPTSRSKATDADPAEQPDDRKPKMKLPTSRDANADVIVQSRTAEPLTWKRQERALKEALKFVRRKLNERHDRAA